MGQSTTIQHLQAMRYDQIAMFKRRLKTNDGIIFSLNHLVSPSPVFLPKVSKHTQNVLMTSIIESIPVSKLLLAEFPIALLAEAKTISQ